MLSCPHPHLHYLGPVNHTMVNVVPERGKALLSTTLDANTCMSWPISRPVRCATKMGHQAHPLGLCYLPTPACGKLLLQRALRLGVRYPYGKSKIFIIFS